MIRFMNKRFAWSAVAFGVTLALLPTLASAALSPAELLAKHHAFMGWAAGDPAVPGLRLTYVPGTVRGATATASAEERAQRSLRITESYRGLLVRSVRDYGRIRTVSGFTGRVFWRSNPNGNTVRLFEDDARQALSTDAMKTNAATLLRGTARPSARVRDRAVEVVRVWPQEGFPIDLSIDPATGEMLRYQIRPDDPYDRTSVDIEGYKEFAPGKKIASVLRYGNQRNTIDLTDVAIEPSLPDATFVPPKPESSWTFGSATPIPVTEVIRSNFIGTGRSIQFHAKVNGIEGNFLLDSGAGGIIVYKSIADKLNLPILAASGFSGVNGGFIPANEIKIDTFTFGDNVLHDVIVQSGGQPLPDLDGIVGYDFFAQAIVDVDLVKKQMVVLDPAKFAVQVDKNAVSFPVNLSSGQPGMAIKLANSVTAHPIFDTGNDFFVLLSDDMRTSGRIVALSQKLIGDIDLRIVFGGVDGSAQQSAPCVRLNRVDVGPYGYENVPVCFADPHTFGKDGGLVGFDFLRHFNWTFDYPEGKLVLTPNGR